MAKPRTRRKPPKTLARKPARKRPGASDHYWDITHRPLQCLVFLLPMVLAYTAWVFRILRGKVTLAHVRAQTGVY